MSELKQELSKKPQFHITIQVYCIIFISPYDDCTGDDILWILIFTRHHRLTPCTHRFMVHIKSSIFVSNIVTLCVR